MKNNLIWLAILLFAGLFLFTQVEILNERAYDNRGVTNSYGNTQSTR